QAEDGIRDFHVTGVQTCALPISLTASFGLYGLIKKKIGPAVDAVSGLTLESFWLIPIAVVQLIIVAQTSGITFGTVGTLHTVLRPEARRVGRSGAQRGGPSAEKW